MRINQRLKTILVLALYIGLTVGIYALAAYFMDMEFQDIHVLYAVLIGCFAYLPRFIADRRKDKQ